MSDSLNPKLDSHLDTVAMQLKSAAHYVEKARAEYATVPKYGPIYQALTLLKSAEKTLRKGLREAQRKPRSRR
jgi:hypothetical protein